MINPKSKKETIFLAELGIDIILISDKVMSPNQLSFDSTLLTKDFQLKYCQFIC